MNPELPFLTTRKVFSVSELVGSVSDLLEAHFGAIFLEGEITNLRQPVSGHLYLTLKDSNAQIKGVVFRRQARLFDFTPENGMTVICRGRLTVYETRGDLQMIIDYMEPSGRGAYRMALEKLKKKLAGEGLFDESRKKQLPVLPRVIGIVTSPTGAAIRDILKVIRKRNERVTVLIYPARVQGAQAPGEIAEGIATFNRHDLADVLIVGRGGGSTEDLDAFNSEEVIRAIAASDIPVISAVGHEIDITLSDLAADVRAPTPTAAAEMVILEKEQWVKRIQELKTRLMHDFQLLIERRRNGLRQLESQLVDPRHRLSLIRMKLDDLLARLSGQMAHQVQIKRRNVLDTQHHLSRFTPRQMLLESRRSLSLLTDRLREGVARLIRDRRTELTGYAALLGSYNPKNVLRRGYSITLSEATGAIVKDAKNVTKGEMVKILLAEGTLGCMVKKRVS